MRWRLTIFGQKVKRGREIHLIHFYLDLDLAHQIRSACLVVSKWTRGPWVDGFCFCLEEHKQ